VIRVAAVGDVHLGEDSAGLLAPHLAHVHERADLLLLAGDLTKRGRADEAAVLAEELADLPIPAVGVLGNHDHHSDQADEVRARLEAAGVRMLEGERCELQIDGVSVGVAGAKGFGGGFAGASGTAFGEPEMKAFIRHTECVAETLHDALAALDTDVRIALLHYAPVADTLRGERLEIFPFLGSYLLGQAIDAVGADLAVHGHAHGGTEKGVTPGGVHVRNVAQTVIHTSYRIYALDALRTEEAVLADS
jgi:Icc-related predicted phosphoesterase